MRPVCSRISEGLGSRATSRGASQTLGQVLFDREKWRSEQSAALKLQYSRTCWRARGRHQGASTKYI